MVSLFYGGETGIYEPMLAFIVDIKCSGGRRKPCMSRRESAAYARVQMVYFHDKKQEEIRLDLLLFFMAEGVGLELNTLPNFSHSIPRLNTL